MSRLTEEQFTAIVKRLCMDLPKGTFRYHLIRTDASVLQTDVPAESVLDANMSDICARIGLTGPGSVERLGFRVFPFYGKLVHAWYDAKAPGRTPLNEVVNIVFAYELKQIKQEAPVVRGPVLMVEGLTAKEYAEIFGVRLS